MAYLIKSLCCYSCFTAGAKLFDALILRIDGRRCHWLKQVEFMFGLENLPFLCIHMNPLTCDHKPFLCAKKDSPFTFQPQTCLLVLLAKLTPPCVSLQTVAVCFPNSEIYQWESLQLMFRVISTQTVATPMSPEVLHLIKTLVWSVLVYFFFSYGENVCLIPWLKYLHKYNNKPVQHWQYHAHLIFTISMFLLSCEGL